MQFLVILLLLIPVIYFIVKIAMKTLNKIEAEEKQHKVASKLEEVKDVNKRHLEVKRVDVDDVRSKKEKIDEVLKA